MGEMTHQEKRIEYNTMARHLRKQRHFCVNCGSEEGIELHHVVPLANGGSNRPSNIVPLCYKCHLAAHGKIYHKKDGVRHGREKTPPPDGYEEALEAYFLKRIGKQELMEVLGLKDKRITQCWWVKKYREENSDWIPKDFYNNIDIKAAKTKQRPNNIGRIRQFNVSISESPSKEEMKRWIDDIETKIEKMPWSYLGSDYTSRFDAEVSEVDDG